MGRFLIRIRSNRPLSENELHAFLERAGIVSERDVDETVVDVFDTFLKALRQSQEQPKSESSPSAAGTGGIRSGEVAKKSGINRITCIHHLQRLEKAGLLEKHEDLYSLKRQSFEDIFAEMKRDMLNSMREMEDLAKKIDTEFEFERSEDKTQQEKDGKPAAAVRRVRIKIE